MDPLADDYVYKSTYDYSENSPMSNIDLDGLERIHYSLVWDKNNRIASLKFSHISNFTETTTNWTPSLTDWSKTTSTTTINPRIEYVVHSTVTTPPSADGMFSEEKVAATFTFRDQESLISNLKSRGTSTDGSKFSDKWFYYNSDQKYKIAGQKAILGVIEAQASKTIYSPNVFRGAVWPKLSGTKRASGLGIPNSTYTYLSSDGKAVSNYIYNTNGKVMYQVDFDKHGINVSGHGHKMTVPGDLGSGHNGNHIPYSEVPKDFLKIPKNVDYSRKPGI